MLGKEHRYVFIYNNLSRGSGSVYKNDIVQVCVIYSQTTEKLPSEVIISQKELMACTREREALILVIWTMCVFMYVTVSGTVSVSLVPIIFIHSETEGQHCVAHSLHEGPHVRPPRILTRSSCGSTPFTLPPLSPWHASHVDGAKRTEASAIKCSISLRCYCTENHAPFSGRSVPGSFHDMHSSAAHNNLRAGQVAPPKARCKASAELSSLKKHFSESQKTR